MVSEQSRERLADWLSSSGGRAARRPCFCRGATSSHRPSWPSGAVLGPVWLGVTPPDRMAAVLGRRRDAGAARARVDRSRAGRQPGQPESAPCSAVAVALAFTLHALSRPPTNGANIFDPSLNVPSYASTAPPAQGPEKTGSRNRRSRRCWGWRCRSPSSRQGLTVGHHMPAGGARKSPATGPDWLGLEESARGCSPSTRPRTRPHRRTRSTAQPRHPRAGTQRRGVGLFHSLRCPWPSSTRTACAVHCGFWRSIPRWPLAVATALANVTVPKFASDSALHASRIRCRLTAPRRSTPHSSCPACSSAASPCGPTGRSPDRRSRRVMLSPLTSPLCQDPVAGMDRQLELYRPREGQALITAYYSAPLPST